ncbi:MAG: sirohydrochlorin chelatase [Gammaproteobacteria bacterium]|nr:sirohydrochlorin chelatase [Gammaproteobacteria bacterium]MDH5802174.1 sirohydrochlorin chelatase [Gammaproteobacteria bacterium]
MNTTVLLVGHGSRHAEGNREIELFATQWRSKNPHWKIQVCFIEFAEVLLDTGLELAARSAARVIVVPLILNAAGHVKMEIPQYIDRARKQFPQVEFIYARHLGAAEPILAILKRNLRNIMMTMDMPDPKSTGVILLGRGSSDRVANGEVAKMARWIFEVSDHERVDIAFTGITYPRLETVVKQQQRLGLTQIAILPYYLFTGTLIERIQRQVARLQQQYPQIHMSCGSYFGFEEEIYRLLSDRVLEAHDPVSHQESGMMECDGCAFRELAQEQGHGHHHHDHHNHDHSHDHSHIREHHEHEHEHQK